MMGAHFKTRKWSNTDARPYDVVFVDVDNHVYYQPNTTFSTEAMAEIHKNSLEVSGNHDTVRKLWTRETV